MVVDAAGARWLEPDPRAPGVVDGWLGCTLMWARVGLPIYPSLGVQIRY
ncbi:hypothetical protein [Enhygromyxa salina]|nr:hypothetical protein [Enhygromyxa salina]